MSRGGHSVEIAEVHHDLMVQVSELSAVDLFDDWHTNAHAAPDHANADHANTATTGGYGDVAIDGTTSVASSFRTLLPASPPGPDQQYRFEVDLDSCTGCKACVTACHSLNGLDETETWRSVGLLVGRDQGPDVAPWQQHVTTACHHCLEPACLAGCPVEAYEKDPISGIVAHLDDQCIGCRYCMLTCPYEVPSFNSRLGIVRKCDMCTDRLAVGEAPACVQGCPTNAISIGVVSVGKLQVELAIDSDSRLVPTAPISAHTQPTTVYLTTKPRPQQVGAGDDHHVVPAHDHPPLVAMLVLTQVSVGAFVLSQALDFADGAGTVSGAHVLVAWLSGLVAIGASVLHLGRPLVAWRAVLGLGHSWLSREIVAFGIYAPLGGATAAAAAGWVPRELAPALVIATAVSGLCGVGCSAKLYAVTGRPYWRLERTAARFLVTMMAGGGAVVALADSVFVGTHRSSDMAAAFVVGGVMVGWASTISFLLRHRGHGDALGRSVSLLLGALRPRLVAALATSAGAAVLAVVLTVNSGGSTGFGGSTGTAGGVGPVEVAGWAGVLVLTLCAAWVERSLYFTGASPDRMPGALR